MIYSFSPRSGGATGADVSGGKVTVSPLAGNDLKQNFPWVPSLLLPPTPERNVNVVQEEVGSTHRQVVFLCF